MINNLLNDDIIIIVDMIRQNAGDTEILETIKSDFAMTDEQARNALSQIKKQLEDDLYICLSIDRSKLTAKNRILTLAIDNLIVIKDDLEYFIEHIIKKKHLKLKNNKNIQDSNLKIKNLKKKMKN